MGSVSGIKWQGGRGKGLAAICCLHAPLPGPHTVVQERCHQSRTSLALSFNCPVPQTLTSKPWHVTPPCVHPSACVHSLPARLRTAPLPTAPGGPGLRDHCTCPHTYLCSAVLRVHVCGAHGMPMRDTWVDAGLTVGWPPCRRAPFSGGAPLAGARYGGCGRGGWARCARAGNSSPAQAAPNYRWRGGCGVGTHGRAGWASGTCISQRESVCVYVCVLCVARVGVRWCRCVVAVIGCGMARCVRVVFFMRPVHTHAAPNVCACCQAFSTSQLMMTMMMMMVMGAGA